MAELSSFRRPCLPSAKTSSPGGERVFTMGEIARAKKKKRVNILHPNLVPRQTVSLHAFEDIVKSK